MVRSTNRANRPVRPAFTMIEIIIVLVVIGLLAAVSVPRIGVTVARDRVRRAQLVVAADVERAFQYAARVRKPLVVALNSTTQVLSVTDRASGTPYFQRDLSRTGEWALTGAAIAPVGGVTIFPTGVSSAALTITLTNNGYTRTVTATIAGQVTKS